MNLQQGQSVTLSDLVGDTERFEMKIAIFDVMIRFDCVVGFDENDLIIDDDYIIDNTQAKTPCHGIVLKNVLNHFDKSTNLLDCQLNNIPLHINRFIFKLSICNAPSIIELRHCTVEFSVTERVISTFNFTNEYLSYGTGMFGEFYRKEGIWYFLANVQMLSKEFDNILHHKKFLIDYAKKDPEGLRRHLEHKIEDEKREQQKVRLLIERAGVSGFIISVLSLDMITKIYKHFMNKSEVFIMNESTLVQKIPSKGNRLLVIKIDAPYIKDINEKPISLEMKNCVKNMKYLGKLSGKTAVSHNVNTNSYQFSNLEFTIHIPKLSYDEKEVYTFDLDFYQETMMDYGFDEIHQRQVATYRTLKLLDSQKPIDIIIKKNKIIAFRQGDQIVPTSHYQDNFNVDIILRSYNFCHFDRSVGGITKDTNNDFISIVSAVDISVIRNYDNEFWLYFKVKWMGNVDIYEHLEILTVNQ